MELHYLERFQTALFGWLFEVITVSLMKRNEMANEEKEITDDMYFVRFKNKDLYIHREDGTLKFFFIAKGFDGAAVFSKEEAEKESKHADLEMVKVNDLIKTEQTTQLPTAKPCPFCGGTDLKFVYKMSRGHGDCGFEKARIECNGCSGAKGNGFAYGEPTEEDELKAWVQWNERTLINK